MWCINYRVFKYLQNSLQLFSHKHYIMTENVTCVTLSVDK